MRIFGGLLAVVLIALAAVMFLQREDVERSLDAVRTVAVELREEGVQGAAFDRRLAERVLESLDELAADPERIGGRVDELKTVASTAAAWAAAADSPSLELRVAVALRTAASELREYGARRSPRALELARRQLEEARAALAGDVITSGPADSIRDRLDNLQQSQRERELEVAEELAN